MSGLVEKLLSLLGGGYWMCMVVFGFDGKMYVFVGSFCNVCEESDKCCVVVWVYDVDGKNGKFYVIGLCNVVGLEWFGGIFYVINNGCDEFGDDLLFEGFY